ncbi:MAG: HAD hydrolase-like protein [Bacteroidia bacterium]|nr:HAD hydrolase-like protein [Bacteroidia bacterium]
MTQLFKNYLKQNNYTHFDLKAILFDMDGVLYDSMSAHAKSWQQTMEELGLKTNLAEFYLHEGRTGASTIDILFQRNLNRSATEEEIQRIYKRKSELFVKYNTGNIIPKAKEALDFVKSKRLLPVLVTGSGQPSLLERLDKNFPNIFTSKTMVTAFDVKIGKPHPEPFLMGLQKGGNLAPNQALAIENAPLGTESASKAGIFTIGVNTGPLNDEILENAGAKLVFHSMSELLDKFPEILDITSAVKVRIGH